MNIVSSLRVRATIHVQRAWPEFVVFESANHHSLREPQAVLRLPMMLATALAISLSYLLLSCSGNGIGAPCARHGDCDSAYQCLAQTCAPRCDSNSMCGDGFQCTKTGVCEVVVSAIGDFCQSEWDCGPRQSCVLDRGDSNGDQRLDASCQEEHPGNNVGARCSSDHDCRSNLCALGHCSQVCFSQGDCPASTGCELIPRSLSNGSALFSGCLQNDGVLSTSIPTGAPSNQLQIPVPSSVQSFSVVSKVRDFSHLVGVTRVVAPSGEILFEESSIFADFFANTIRYLRDTKISTMMVPSNGTLTLETGMYQVDVEASLPPFGRGTAIPEVTVFYNFRTQSKLDLHFYFLNLSEHPCRENFDAETLSAETAPVSARFQQEYLEEIRRIFAQANIQAGSVHYSDIVRADLDGITNESSLRELFRLSKNQEGIAIFFVRSLSPDGVQARGVGIPGPPRSPGTASSGIAVSADTLCYRSWTDLARVTAYGVAKQMGLWNNRSPLGTPDPIADSDLSRDNLMFFGEFGGTELSPGQARVLTLYPGLR